MSKMCYSAFPAASLPAAPDPWQCGQRTLSGGFPAITSFDHRPAPAQ